MMEWLRKEKRSVFAKASPGQALPLRKLFDTNYHRYYTLLAFAMEDRARGFACPERVKRVEGNPCKLNKELLSRQAKETAIASEGMRPSTHFVCSGLAIPSKV